MIKNLINLKNAAIVAVFAVLAFVGFNSFKANDTKVRTSVSQWFSITPTSSSTPASQTITGQISAPDEFNDADCAQQENEGDFCAVLIEFESGTVPNVNSGSVADLLSTYEDSSIKADVATDGYSRLPAAK